MVVYVEYVFLDNFIIDYALISLARQSLKLPTKRRSKIISSVFGGLVAVITPLLHFSLGVSFLFKIPIGFLVVLLSGRFKNLSQCLKCFYLFLFFTFSLGGFVTAIFWGLGLSFDPASYSHGGEIPLFLILVLVFLSYRLSLTVIRNIYKRKRVTSFAISCAIKIGGKTFVRQGYLDSGNTLTYKNQTPIVVCSSRFANELEKQGVLKDAYKDTVKINTVSGEDALPIYKTERFLIYLSDKANILNNVMIGVASGSVFPNGEYDLLLGPSLVEV